MPISTSFTQKRRKFGKTCHFTDVGPYLVVDIDSDPELKKKFIKKTNIDKGTQCSSEMSQHQANTVLCPTKSCGMNHTVGGWPSDVDPKDEDQVARFKKKIQKDENFITTIKRLGDIVENFVMENNSINIYEDYFYSESTKEVESQFKTLSVFRDYSSLKRKSIDLSWSLDGCKIAVAHAFNSENSNVINACYDSYVWDTGLWDVRVAGHPQQITPVGESHKESVSDLKWISSKTGMEFFSGSVDGKLFCWDSRNMKAPIINFEFNQGIQEKSNMNKSYGITCLEYDPTLPNRFMVGTEQGIILSCNRKHKDPKEMIQACYDIQSGPVIGIERNAFFPKLFASCGSWGVKIWSEDLAVSSMLNLQTHDEYVTDAAWSAAHASYLFITKTSGILELWDILVKMYEPILSVKVKTESLLCIRPKQQGDQVACGTLSGCIHLLEVPECYTTTSKHEKNLVSAMIDREGKREKVLEGKTREQRMRDRIMDGQSRKLQANDAEVEKLQEVEDKADNAEVVKEFESEFDPSLKCAEDELGDSSTPETPGFDMQFTDTLETVLDAAK
ncbi:dynein intermediate chain 3, ciliary-like [Uloborus diversus]|uniref:dynein intermediate chain 3, ciliary-like n=1 Tax=Uloborus diversus TaxID=327109 RepID=UPI0024092C24|nr:dynein intermediate chain 3, ciliary-like [Uloborus diversus]